MKGENQEQFSNDEIPTSIHYELNKEDSPGLQINDAQNYNYEEGEKKYHSNL